MIVCLPVVSDDDYETIDENPSAQSVTHQTGKNHVNALLNSVANWQHQNFTQIFKR